MTRCMDTLRALCGACVHMRRAIVLYVLNANVTLLRGGSACAATKDTNTRRWLGGISQLRLPRGGKYGLTTSKALL
jgi:hypothetical protein